MIELERICREAAALRSRGVPLLLATVVRVSGSAYRRPGARMLIAEDRWMAGSVSGGCLERDILLRGAFHTRGGSPVLVTYDTTSDDDARWGGARGCHGVIEVLIERIDPRSELDPTHFASSCFTAEEVGALATVFASDDPLVPVGARVAARRGHVVGSTLPEGTVRDTLAQEALAALVDGACRARIHLSGRVEALVELFTPAPHLFVLGTRHDALPLVTLAHAIGLTVTVADTWAPAATRTQFAAADCLLFAPPHEIARAVDAHARAAVVVMTHDYERDRDHLAAILGTRARYIGVLGPRARTARMLADAGVKLTDDMLGRLHAPVGLDLGGETPTEIALAVVAEIQAALAGASTRPLRELPGAIHADERQAAEPNEPHSVEELA
ncbi:MAG TPA: XdhC family protein [Polyangiaceae bacterium]